MLNRARVNVARLAQCRVDRADDRFVLFGMSTVEIIELDSRTSDAVAIALRFNSPIYTYESIMSVGGIILDPEDENLEKVEDEIQEGNEFSGLSFKELDAILLKAIEHEDYERASLIRDELSRRKK